MERVLEDPGPVGGWVVDRIVRFADGQEWGGGYSLLGFHDADGTQFAVVHGEHWVGAFDGPDAFAWTAGRVRPPGSRVHVDADLEFPMYLARASDGSFLVSNFRSARVVRIVPRERRADVLIDGPSIGLRDAGNCVVDSEGCVWVNEVTGCRLWRFDPDGAPVACLGTGEPGFRREPVAVDEVRFSSIYDIRLGPAGRLFVLDSGNFAVRVVDPALGMVDTLVGTGAPGYTGDGGDGRAATLGSDPAATFDGPLSLSVDGRGSIFIGDTRNHVVREVDGRTNVITTIAGVPTARRGQRNVPGVSDPRSLRLFEICSMDYHRGRLFVPEMSGDLVILRRSPPFSG